MTVTLTAVHMQAGGLEVFASLLTNLPRQQSASLLSSSSSPIDDDSDDESESTVVQESWSAAVGIMLQVVLHNDRGAKQMVQVQQYCHTARSCFSLAHLIPRQLKLTMPHVHMLSQL